MTLTPKTIVLLLMNHHLAVSIDNLSWSYKDLKVLSAIHLQVSRGQTICIHGQNGSGKTTLLKIISGLLIPQKKSVVINNICTLKHGKKVRKLISWSQASDTGFFNYLTGFENLKCFYLLSNNDEQYFLNELKKMKVHPIVNKTLNSKYIDMSTGMKQVLSFLRGYITERPLVLLDEPTRSLSTEMQTLIIKCIKNKDPGKTFIIASHNAELINSFKKYTLTDGHLKCL